MKRFVVRVLWWIGKACNHLHWCRHYFIFQPTDPEEMAECNRRLKW